MENLLNGFTYLISNYMSNIQLLSKWLMKRYLVLWENLRDRNFTLDEAADLLARTKFSDSKKLVTLLLSELRKSGWVATNFDPKDARKRIYRLTPYEQIFELVVKENDVEEVNVQN